MSDMPKRIWAGKADLLTSVSKWWRGDKDCHGTEYIRADLAAEEKRELLACIRSVRDEFPSLDEFEDDDGNTYEWLAQKIDACLAKHKE